MNNGNGSFTSTMQQIIEAIGFDRAISLVARYGGTRIRVTSEPTERDVVARVIGVDAAQALASILGSGSHELPRCASWLVARRNEEITIRHQAGETHAALALRFGLTERHIKNIVAAAREAIE